ncbi:MULTISPECIES: HPr kinase/phosphorylase [Falsihalocynthiibacter]|uniref:HPr kinase/phosphorylase n=1 Tax=Falsihalocynthiibacter TaxID=2854182 RepID=UPI00300150F4
METNELHHASTVAIDGKAAVIFGCSGSGKSTLALRMISLGATLISDDQTQLSLEDGVLVALAVPEISGKLEVRGVGIIYTPFEPRAIVSLFVDMDKVEETRLPPAREIVLLGQKATLYHCIKGDHFADALMQILKYGRSD